MPSHSSGNSSAHLPTEANDFQRERYPFRGNGPHPALYYQRSTPAPSIWMDPVEGSHVRASPCRVAHPASQPVHCGTAQCRTATSQMDGAHFGKTFRRPELGYYHDDWRDPRKSALRDMGMICPEGGIYHSLADTVPHAELCHSPVLPPQKQAIEGTHSGATRRQVFRHAVPRRSPCGSSWIRRKES